MELAFRLYNNGQELVFVCFPQQGGGAVLRKSWNLESICLDSVNIPNRRDMPFGTHKIQNRKSLVRGGFVIQINYRDGNILVTPKTRQNSKLNDRSQLYNFKGLGVQYNSETNTFGLDEQRLNASLDTRPIEK